MTWHRHILANVFWSDNGWTELESAPRGRRQFKWVFENERHADADLFNWAEQEAEGGYVPANVMPRLYMKNHNGNGMLFIASKNHQDGKYYIVGVLSDCHFDLSNAGSFECLNLENSLRFATYIPLDIRRHCPDLKDGSERRAIFGRNNFNYLRDEWAHRILQDALAAQPRFGSRGQLPAGTYTGESPRTVIQRILKTEFSGSLAKRA